MTSLGEIYKMRWMRTNEHTLLWLFFSLHFRFCKVCSNMFRLWGKTNDSHFNSSGEDGRKIITFLFLFRIGQLAAFEPAFLLEISARQ